MRWYGWIALGIAGCTGASTDVGTGDDDDDVEGCSAGDLAVDIGTGADVYQALADGDVVTMVHGPQGGWHVETAGLVTQAQSDVSIHPQILVPDLSGLMISGTQQASFNALVGYSDTTCEGTFFGVRSFIDPASDTSWTGTDQEFICSLEGLTLEFSVEVKDIATDRSTTDTVSVIANLDPADVPNCP
ncbi:MAG: hypothetical protein ABMB14_08140 [Myxococcota bacterium]